MDLSVLEEFSDFLSISHWLCIKKYAVLLPAQEQQILYEEKDAISKTHEMVNWTPL